MSKSGVGPGAGFPDGAQAAPPPLAVFARGTPGIPSITHMQTHAHHALTATHASLRTHSCLYMNTRARAHTHTHTHTHTFYTCMHIIYIYVYMCICYVQIYMIHTHTHTHTQICIYTYACMHFYACIQRAAGIYIQMQIEQRGRGLAHASPAYMY
jgi:hypothetical protein